jgi:hypothetical protein
MKSTNKNLTLALLMVIGHSSDPISDKLMILAENKELNVKTTDMKGIDFMLNVVRELNDKELISKFVLNHSVHEKETLWEFILEFVD